MPKITIVYGLHFNEMAGQYQEDLEFEGAALKDLIGVLEEKYGGFDEELVDPEKGGLKTTNQILLQREEAKTTPLFTLDAEIHDGDTLTFF